MRNEEDIKLFKISIIPYLMKAWHKNNVELANIIEKYDIFGYIDDCYESYEYMGVGGVIADIEEFIKEAGGKI